MIEALNHRSQNGLGLIALGIIFFTIVMFWKNICQSGTYKLTAGVKEIFRHLKKGILNNHILLATKLGSEGKLCGLEQCF